MRLLIRRLLAATALFAAPLAAQTAPTKAAPAAAPTPATTTAATVDADPALWVVRDDDTTIYLFGTVHMLKPGLSWFDEAVKTAFDASNEVVLEMVKPDDAAMAQTVMALATNPTGPTLTERLPVEVRPKYTAALSGMGIPPAAFDRFKPWMVATQLTLLPLMKLGYQPNSGADNVITAAATAAGKPIIGLETAEQQLGFFNGLPEASQIRFLTSTINELPAVETEFGAMMTSWSQGDAEAIARLMNESMIEQPELEAALLTNRNARWADWIATRMNKPGTVFIAVGAGHLAGTNSVQAMLAKKKVASSRVAY